jgi:hypothetical protein
MMVSFDVMSLFIRVSIREAMSLLDRHFEEDILILTSSSFSFAGQFHEQTDVVTTGSPPAARQSQS